LLKEHRRLNLELGSGRGIKRVEELSRADIEQELDRVRQELYEVLVVPWEQYVSPGQRVLIVPDHFTGDLPFAALGGSKTPWILRNPVRLLPNAQFLATERSKGRRAVVIGDPVMPAQGRESKVGAGLTAASVEWATLPGTRLEAEKVARMYRTDALLREEATEQNLRELAPRAKVLLIASHGLAMPTKPGESALVLSAPDEAGGDDGILHAYEIERLTLPGTLVVLSACETGRGQTRGNEGTLALDRAFLTAGAGVVVSSLWLVDDQATAELMEHMHRELRKGRPADVALAHAMRAVREMPGWSDPYFWSGFRVVGGGWRE
jgi:CHAT domain-containing protein